MEATRERATTWRQHMSKMREGVETGVGGGWESNNFGEILKNTMPKTKQHRLFHTQPAQTQAATSHYTHTAHTSEKPAGSQLTEDCCEEKGMGSGPSPPTYPLANSLRLVVVVAVVDPRVEGAKAVADPKTAAKSKQVLVVMVSRNRWKMLEQHRDERGRAVRVVRM